MARVKKPIETGIVGRRDTRRGRFYDIATGEAYPSVTTFLGVLNKPALIGWAAKMERQLLEVAFQSKFNELREVMGEHLAELSGQEFVSQTFTELGTAKAHQRKLREAADIGTQVHKRIEFDILEMLAAQKGEVLEFPEPAITHPKAMESYRKYLSWKESVKMVPLSTEMPIVSHVHKYAGTEDIRLHIWPAAEDPVWGMVTRQVKTEDGIIVTGDFKTGKAVYGEMFLQNGAYRLAEKEMGIEPDSDAGIIIRLPKEADDPEFEIVAVPPLEETIPAVLALRAAFNWHRKDEERYDRLREAKKRAQEAEQAAA